MSANIEKLKKLNDLVGLSFRSKHTIVLNPDERDENQETLGDNIMYDKAKWNISKELSDFVGELSNNNELSTEDKIILIFEKVCKDYTYDDNLISYIKEIGDDMYTVPDWYGQNIDDEWEKNREEHNRRVCYELSRYIAKALTELFKDSEKYNVCIHWNKNLTHYFVGLTCDDYSVTLDADNFFNNKDLTRLKTGLTAEGITILEDNNDKFKKALDKFNEGRSEYAINKIKTEIDEDSQNINPDTIILNTDEAEENEEIIFLKKALEILNKKYDIDSQGIFEYIKEIVDIRLGANMREKIWKRMEGETKESTRYIRCLVVNADNQKFLIDVDQKAIRPFNEEELNMKRTRFIPYNELSPRGGYDYYDGR